MAEYRAGDAVEAARDITVPGGTIERGRSGRVLTDTRPDVMTVRVRFVRDPLLFRVVLKSAVRRR